MVDPTSPGLNIGVLLGGWLSALLFGLDASVFMPALIGSLMAQAKFEPQTIWWRYVLPVAGYTIFALALTDIAVQILAHFKWDIGSAAPAIAFLLAFFRVFLIQAAIEALKRVPSAVGGGDKQ